MSPYFPWEGCCDLALPYGNLAYPKIPTTLVVKINEGQSNLQFSSVAQSCPTLCDSMDCNTPGFPVHDQFMSIESVMPFNHLILCCPLLLLTSIFPSIRVPSDESALCIRWPKYWSFSFNISPSNEYSGLISFRMDWQDLRAVQETLKSLLQQHNSKA